MPRFYYLFVLVWLGFAGAAAYAAEDAAFKVTVAPIHLPLVADETIPLTFTLYSGNDRVLTSTDLAVTHTQPIHMLAIDPTLTDYHHLHPEPGQNPGTYKVTFAPATNGPYRVFVQTMDAKTKQPLEASVDIGGAFSIDAAHLPAPATQVVMDGYKFMLLVPDTGLRAGQETMVTLQVMRNDQGVKNLEPIMGAFAHMVGFTADSTQTVHLHPMGDEPANDTDRGGPQLMFHITPPAPGLLPLFAQVKIAGKTYTLPFVVDVATSKK